MKIRHAEARDVEAVGLLLQEISRIHHEGRPDLFRVGQKYDNDELLQVFADPQRVVLVAEADDGRVAGYAICILLDNHGGSAATGVKTLYLDDLCVDSSLRSHGIGAQLLEAAKSEARAHGCYNLTLNVWACNPQAHRFYERCGMQVQKYGMECLV